MFDKSPKKGYCTRHTENKLYIMIQDFKKFFQRNIHLHPSFPFDSEGGFLFSEHLLRINAMVMKEG